MGLFNKLFGKNKPPDHTPPSAAVENVQLQEGDKFISTGDGFAFKVIRPLSHEQKERIQESTILLRTGKLYMHYWTDNLTCTDGNDPEWQNKVMFFWKAEEPFPKKSLPPVFKSFAIKYFLFTGKASGLSLKVGQAMPWFGMPGGGEKRVCEINGVKVTIPELNKLGMVEYVELVELTHDNLDLLTNNEEYLFWIDERITTFQQGNFYLRGKPIPIDVAYSIGGIHLIKSIRLEE